ncbi:MAG: TPM domain-containing protein [Oscillospiraceae bacterium]|jgi:uncharacterized protein|nr:TPM domain-containing protein [Oscillospiraceae bacterium]
MIKRCEIACIYLAIFFISAFTIFAIPNHTDQFYINDFANIFSEDVKNYIFSSSKTLEEKTTAQVVVVAVQSLEQRDLESFSLDLFRSWKIGNKDKNNGLLILIAPKERVMRIEVGDGLEGAINDSKAGRFRDLYATPYFKENNWDEGVKQLYSAILSEVYKEYNMEVPENISESFKRQNWDIPSYVPFIVIAIAVILIIKLSQSGRPPFTRGSNFGDGGFSGDDFGGGGFSGGGFSGGGGSSSGGGASGGF